MNVSSNGFLNIISPDCPIQGNSMVSYVFNTGYKYFYGRNTTPGNLCQILYMSHGLFGGKNKDNKLIVNLSELIKTLSEIEKNLKRKVHYTDIVIGFILLNSPYELIEKNTDEYIKAYLNHYYIYQDYKELYFCPNIQFMQYTFSKILKEKPMKESRDLLDIAFGRSIKILPSEKPLKSPFITNLYSSINEFFKFLDYPIQYIDYFEDHPLIIEKALSHSSFDPDLFRYNKNALISPNPIKLVVSSDPLQSSFIMKKTYLFSNPESIESQKHIISFNRGETVLIQKIMEKTFAKSKNEEDMKNRIKKFIELFGPIPENVFVLKSFSIEYLETFAHYCDEPKSEHIILRLYISIYSIKPYRISSQLKDFNFTRNPVKVINGIRYMFKHIHKAKSLFVPYIIEDNSVSFLNFITKSWNFLIDINLNIIYYKIKCNEKKITK